MSELESQCVLDRGRRRLREKTRARIGCRGVTPMLVSLSLSLALSLSISFSLSLSLSLYRYLDP